MQKKKRTKNFFGLKNSSIQIPNYNSWKVKNILTHKERLKQSFAYLIDIFDKKENASFINELTIHSLWNLAKPMTNILG